MEIDFASKIRVLQQIAMTDNASISVKELTIYNSNMSSADSEEMLSVLVDEGYVTKKVHSTELEELPDTYYLLTNEGAGFVKQNDMWEGIPILRQMYYEGLDPVPDDLQPIREHSDQKPASSIE